MDEPLDLSKLVFHFPETDKLNEALAKAQGAFQSAKKDSTNPHLRSKYASLASVWSAIRKPLHDNGLAVTQPISMSCTGETMLFTILRHSSGQQIVSALPVPKLEAKGVTEIQSFGSAITYLCRYMLQAMVGLPSEDDDGNSAVDTGSKSGQSRPSQSGSQTTKPASQGNASKGAPPATQETPSASSATPAGSDNTTQDGLPTLGGITYNQVNGEIHAIGKATYDHKDLLKACGFSFRSADKVWFKKAA